MIFDYLPGLLATNETLEHLRGSCKLDCFTAITPDKEEHELCPVRTLKPYLLKTTFPDRIPHDVRAVAASLQMRHCPPYKALRNSSGWTTPTVFLMRYGRGESINSEAGKEGSLTRYSKFK